MFASYAVGHFKFEKTECVCLLHVLCVILSLRSQSVCVCFMCCVSF